ncbi:GNAT family N-acetyltransferase [Parasalinivibrio latis]|uniref:GNAT family N-acetyltransferase n=1 Tax=Parasalinivibrio latis TaxID=2952610 RepID=UPI0030E29E04
MHLDLKIFEAPSADMIQQLNHALQGYLESQLPGLSPESEDKVFMVCKYDEQGNLVGGLLANCYWNGLEIDTLWVADSERGKGVGSLLVESAESYGAKNGAVIAFLKTMDAKPFYEKLGYEVYGVLEDRPIGTLLYHMKKRI